MRVRVRSKQSQSDGCLCSATHALYSCGRSSLISVKSDLVRVRVRVSLVLLQPLEPHLCEERPRILMAKLGKLHVRRERLGEGEGEG